MSFCSLKLFNDFLFHVEKKPKLYVMVHKVLAHLVAGHLVSSASLLAYCAFGSLNHLKDSQGCQGFFQMQGFWVSSFFRWTSLIPVFA